MDITGQTGSGDISATEKAELEALLKTDPEATTAQALVREIWQAPLQEVNPSNEAPERIWDHVSQQLTTDAPVSKLRRLLLPAAAAAAILLLGWAGWRFIHPAGTRELRPPHMAHCNKSRIILPDGTQVWLNRDSRVTYDEHSFGREQRELTLSGEAFFDVAQNSAHPFIIHAGKVDIRVLGTAFNVKAYTTDSLVSTTLIRGKIAVSFREQTVVLQPEEKLTIPLTTMAPVTRQQIEKDSSGAAADLSWLHHKLVFDNNTFGELAVKMNDWYGVTIHFESGEAQQLRFTGIIDTEQIDEALKILQLSRPFHFRINGKEVWISN